MVAAFRFDTGAIRKPEFTKEGYIRAEAVFAKDGILEYKLPNGEVRKEFRPPEENRKALTKFGLKPVSFEHPPVLINSANSQEYGVGLSDSTVVYDPGGYVRGVITVLAQDAVNAITRGDTRDISCGYKCDIEEIPGIWNGERYDAIQRNIDINHIAITKRGRAGAEVGINFDSETFPYHDVAVQIGNLYDEQNFVKENKEKRMASITLDSVTYDDIPESVAAVIGSKISQLSEVAKRADSLEKNLADKEKLIAELTDEKDTALGRADGYEEIVNEAVPILSNHGYEWDYESSKFVVNDSKGKKKPMMMEDEDDDEEYMEDEEDMEDMEEMPYKPKSKSKFKPKTKKMDSIEEVQAVRRDDLAYLLETWKKVEDLGYGQRFDSSLSARGIQQEVLQEIYPELDFDGLSDSYVEGLFESSYEQYGEGTKEVDHSDADDYASNLYTAIQTSRSSSSARNESKDAPLSNAWQQPLSLSK
jgi:hypothetical protein